MENAWQKIGWLSEAGESLVVVTVTGVRGSVPGVVGAKMVVGERGRLEGTVGGGKIEAKVIGVAEELLRGGEVCSQVTWNLQKDIGMTCGGEMSFLFERLVGAPSWHVVVFGAGHVSQALVRVLATLSCRVDVVDERAEWLSELPTGKNVERHEVANFEDGVSLVREDSFVVSMTKGHASDRPILREILRKFPRLAFLGVIGSQAKRAVLLRELKEDGIAEQVLELLECPVGLALGGNAPAEIAISIAAQLLERRDASKEKARN